jgi:hypothetical protein
MRSPSSLPSLSRSVGAGLLLVLFSVLLTALFSAIAGVIGGTLLAIFLDIKTHLPIFTFMADVITLLAPLPALHYALQIVQRMIKDYRGIVLYGIFMFYTVQAMIGAWLLPDEIMILGVNIAQIPNLAVKQTIIACLTMGVFHRWVYVEKKYGVW